MRAAMSFLALGTVFLGVEPCVAAPPAVAGTCPEIARAAPPDSTARKANALALLGSVTQLLSPLGRPILGSNYATTVAINNEATSALRAQALVDALITNENANTVADGLGATMAAIYREKATYTSDDDGAHPHCGQVGPAVTALINAVNAVSAVDSGLGKTGYADAKKMGFPLPPGGTYDVLGKAYGHEAGSLGAGHLGNSRPFQTAPIWASSGPAIQTFGGTDFFGTTTNSRLLMMGPTAADTADGRTGSDLTNSPSFPSGHTTFGYTEALILAMMVPERYRALAYRGSEYGNSRIVLGAHYTLDVIGGRTLATYDLAQDLAGRPGYAQVSGHSFRGALAAAAAELRALLQQNGCPRIAACAARDPIVRANSASVPAAGIFMPATPAEAYEFRLHYGLPDLRRDKASLDPIPKEAATLLETRFPYLSEAQRLDVIRSTEGPPGQFLDVSPLTGAPLAESGSGAESEAGAYSRLNLFAAAGGFASLTGQVSVDQDVSSITDPDLRPFLDLARADTWSNDIGGSGGLTKRGAGTLTLSGANTFAGPVIVSGGTLDVTGSLVAKTEVEGGTLAGSGRVGDVEVRSGGTLQPGDGVGALEIGGALTFGAGGTYVIGVDPSAARIKGQAMIDGARLIVTTGPKTRPGVSMTILTAQGGISGTFAKVSVDGSSLTPTLSYAGNAVTLTFEDKTVPKGTAP